MIDRTAPERARWSTRRALVASLALVGMLLAPLPATAGAEPIATANFHTIGLYWTRPENPDGVQVQYRRPNSTGWRAVQPLWWDGLTTIPEFQNQYRGSIVNLRPGSVYNVRYSLDGGLSWVNMADVRTRSEKFPGTSTTYTGVRTTKLVITEGGTSTNWKIHDGQGSAIIDTNHEADCVQVSAPYVIVRGFTIRDCKYNAVTIQQPNVIIENNTIEDWGIQEIAFDNPAPRIGYKSKKRLSDPLSTCVAGTAKGDFGRFADAGVNVSGASNDGIVIQRNVVRNPRYRSTRWQECRGYDDHPYGPRAILINGSCSGAGFATGNVIRYNDIYATNTTGGGAVLNDDANRYYDVVGVNCSQDLDVYGNIIRNGTDDALEADNAAVNVRIWGNYFDYSLTGVSHQYMEAGPSYIFRNVFDRGADNDVGNPGTWDVGIDGGYTSDSPFKLRQNNGGTANFKGPAFVFHNTALRAGSDGFNFGYSIFAQTIARDKGEYRNVFSYNNILMSARYYMYDTSPKNWLDSVFADMYNRPQNMNYPYPLDSGLWMTAAWKDGHGPSAPWSTPPASPSGLYEAVNAGTGVPLANFNDAASRGRGADSYQPAASEPMQFGIAAQWTYVPTE